MYCLWGFVCVCWREMLLWGPMGQGHYKAGVCAVHRTALSWLACTYTLTHADRGLLWTPRPSWSVLYSNSLSPFLSQALAFFVFLSLYLYISFSHFLPHGFQPWFCFSFSFWHCVGLVLTCFEPFRPSSWPRSSVIPFSKPSCCFHSFLMMTLSISPPPNHVDWLVNSSQKWK